uniref:Uncharacterized protein n=1 Tax=Brassica campestris TaxID=3711 RepID=A0A3P5YT46_BRACM|nr:unnamed protein product [Brassica rapa]
MRTRTTLWEDPRDGLVSRRNLLQIIRNGLIPNPFLWVISSFSTQIATIRWCKHMISKLTKNVTTTTVKTIVQQSGRLQTLQQHLQFRSQLVFLLLKKVPIISSQETMTVNNVNLDSIS